MKTEQEHPKWDRIGGFICLALLLMQMAVVLLSWIISTTNPQLSVHSLLGGEGIRWFFGHFMHIIGNGGAAYIILILIACGAVRQSRILSTLKSFMQKETLSFRQKYALQCAAVALLLFIAVLAVLTCTKEAVLESATGNLFPSSFSMAVIPILAFILTAIAILFGTLSAQFRNIGDVFRALCCGLERGAPLFVIYLFTVQLVASLAWAFGR